MDLPLMDTKVELFVGVLVLYSLGYKLAILSVWLDSFSHSRGLWSVRCDDQNTCVRVCGCILVCACVNSGPTAHFTHRQTSKRSELTLRVEATLHAIRNFTSLSLQQHQTFIPIHIEMNRRSSAMQRITILGWGKIKTSKGGRYIWNWSRFLRLRVWLQGKPGIFLHLCFRCGQSAGIAIFLIKAGKLCFPRSAGAEPALLSLTG